jgi:hypothetical protein
VRTDVTADVFDEVGNFDLCMRHVSYVAVLLVKRRTPLVGPKDIIRRVFIAGHRTAGQFLINPSVASNEIFFPTTAALPYVLPFVV